MAVGVGCGGMGWGKSHLTQTLNSYQDLELLYSYIVVCDIDLRVSLVRRCASSVK